MLILAARPSYLARPTQIHRIVTKNGGHFTLMVVGESGLGKTTRESRLLGVEILPLSLPVRALTHTQPLLLT